MGVGEIKRSVKMSSGKYIIKDKKPIEVANLLEWAKEFENSDRKVAHTKIGDTEVCTVFLGIDHNYLSKGSPILFETMVFGGPLNNEEERYSTWKEAEEGHEEMVHRVREARELFF